MWVETGESGPQEVIVQSLPRGCDLQTLKEVLAEVGVEEPFENEKRVSFIPDRRQKNNSGGAQALFTCKTACIARYVVQQLN